MSSSRRALLPMYEQVRRALAWVWRNAEGFGGDRERFYISAHSSGSHLAACVLTGGWREEDCRRILQGRGPAQAACTSSSGAALEALVLCQVHRRHGGEAQFAAAISAAAHAVILAYGTQETPEFPAPDPRFLRRVRALGGAAD